MPGRTRNSTRPGANGVVELSPFEFLDRLADLVPPPRKHRHRYHGVFAPARGPPTAWGELVQAHDDREAVQVSPDDLPVIDIHSL
ncbi:MAG: transposase [Planctomycetia bacterium]